MTCLALWIPSNEVSSVPSVGEQHVVPGPTITWHPRRRHRPFVLLFSTLLSGAVLTLYPQRPPPLSQTDRYSLALLALLADIDECANSNTCGDARCKNLPGSYSCLCDKGYTYSSQEKTCQGTHAAATQVTSLTLSLGHTWVTAWMWAALLYGWQPVVQHSRKSLYTRETWKKYQDLLGASVLKMTPKVSPVSSLFVAPLCPYVYAHTECSQTCVCSSAYSVPCKHTCVFTFLQTSVA